MAKSRKGMIKIDLRKDVVLIDTPLSLDSYRKIGEFPGRRVS